VTSARTQALKVGTLVSGALVLLMVALLFVGRGQNFWQRKVQYQVHFLRTNGLLFGAPVALNGVNIGSVTGIGFPADPEARHITVDIEVTRRSAPRIREDTVASIRTQGVLGDKYVELSAGTPTAPPREPGSVIPAIAPVDYEAVLGQSGDIVDNIVELTASLRNVLQAIDRGEGLLGAIVRSREQGELTFGDIQQAIANLAKITAHAESIMESVERGEGFLGALVRDTSRAEVILSRLARSADQLEQFAQRLNTADGLMPRLIEDEDLGERLVSNIDATAKDLAEVTAKVKRGEGTLGALVNDPTLYDETTEFVKSTRKSWLVGLYRGIRGLWPFEGGGGDANGTENPTEERDDRIDLQDTSGSRTGDPDQGDAAPITATPVAGAAQADPPRQTR